MCLVLNWNFKFSVVFLAFFCFFFPDFVFIVTNELSFECGKNVAVSVLKMLHTLFLASTYNSAGESKNTECAVCIGLRRKSGLCKGLFKVFTGIFRYM